jgi:polyisoprenoid-binding protein YceI
MTAHELHARISSGKTPHLIHVLPPEIFAAVRIPGSLNACVYEMAFSDQVRSAIPDPSERLIVYGAGGDSLDAITAAEKLQTDGYAFVEVFAGGIAEWQAAGFPVEGSGVLPQPPTLDGVYRMDPETSIVRWTGRNWFNHHSGTVRLASGEIHLRAGDLVSAKFLVDLTTIVCEDLQDGAMNALLIQHLKSPDFFDVANHPTAEFVSNAVELVESATEGTPGHVLRGTFTLRGISQAMEFPVVLATKEDGRHLTGQAQMEFDRTAYGSHYGSGKFFRFLGQHLVNDHVQLHVKIHAKKE